MSRRLQVLLRAVLAISLASASVIARAETLQEAIESTLKSNPDVRIEAARRRSIDEGLKQARAGFFPKVDLTTGLGRERLDNPTTFTTYGGGVDQSRRERSLTLSQMLFDGFGVSSEVDRNLARVDSQANRVAGVSEQITLKAVEAYLEVLRQVEVIQMTRQNLLVHEKTYDQIKLRAQSGVGRKSDLDQIEARLALTRANLTSAESNLEVAEVNFKLIVGRMPKDPVKPPPPPLEALPKSVADALKFAMESNRIMRSARADVEAALAQHQAAKAGYYPRVDLELATSKANTASRTDSLHYDSNTAMVRMRYNLFRGGADTAKVAETRHQIDEATEVMRRTERQLEQSTRLSWNAFRTAVDRLPNLQKHAAASLLTRDAYTKQFALGQRTLLDLLDSENEYYTASINLLNGSFVEHFSRYRLLADLGTLLETIGVNPLAEAAGERGKPRIAPVAPGSEQVAERL